MNRSLLLSLLALGLLFVTGCGAEVEGDEAGECSDGVDNDQDGTLDCGDAGCAISTTCKSDPWRLGFANPSIPGADGGLREEPSAASTVLQQLDAEDELYILEEKGEWSRVAVLSNPKEPVVGWIPIAGIRPFHAEQVYRAWLSAQDRRTSKGVAISKAVVILRQDRANFHKFGKRDDGDTMDSWFDRVGRRADLVNGNLKVVFDEGAAAIIEKQIAYVQVVLGESTVSVSILEKGAPYAAPAKAERAWDPEAAAECGRHCKFCDIDDLDSPGLGSCARVVECLRKAGDRRAESTLRVGWCAMIPEFGYEAR